MYRLLAALSASLFMFVFASAAAEPVAGTVVTERFTSEILRANKVGLDLQRSISVYLPPGYARSTRSYPVIYYFHGMGWSNERMFSAENSPQPLFDRAIAKGTIGEFIFVAADYSSPTLGSWFENSTTSGLWIDYTLKEVLPYVESHFRTIRHRDSRALSGEFTGGYGALKFAMLYPEFFSVVYALHPVGTGTGLTPMHTTVDWKRVHQARSFDELSKIDYYVPGAVAMSQAYLPNPDRPPFYCDFIVEIENGEPVLNVQNLEKLQTSFLLDRYLPRYAKNLRTMRGIAFDWGRYDRTQTHVYSNQAFTRALSNLGIEHLAEEYSGNQFDKNWIEHGRVEERMLPFVGRLLKFK